MQPLRNKTIRLTDELYEYLFRHSVDESDVLLRLRQETYELGDRAGMMSPPESAQFLAFLIETLNAKNVLEVGVFTGYTTLRTAMALPLGGRIVACDVSEEWTAIGRRYWQEAGVDSRIDLFLQPATATLNELIAQGKSNTFDLMFIDADKVNYDAYYEAGLRLVKRGGLIAIDNALWGGGVIDPDDQTADTAAIRALNSKVVTDPRVSISMLPVSDGLTLCRKV